MSRTISSVANNLTELRFGDEIVLVSAVLIPGTESTSASDRVREHAVDALEQARGAIEAVAKSAVETANHLKRAAVAPASIEVELGIAFTVQGGVVVAGGGVAASLIVHLTYELTPRTEVHPSAQASAHLSDLPRGSLPTEQLRRALVGPLPTRASNGLFHRLPIDTQYLYDGTKFLSVRAG